MKPEDNLNIHLESLTGGDPRSNDVVSQLLECRAAVKDGQLNNRFLNELVLKYAEAEKNLRQLNQELLFKQRRLEQDLQSAGEIQRSLLPKKSTLMSDLEVAWKFEPCEKIGGDIFNLVQLNETHWAIFVIDVSGHGVPAAMVAVSVFQFLQPQSGNLMLPANTSLSEPHIRPPAQLFDILDREYAFERFENFFTINYVILDTATGSLISCSAGHPPPIVLRQDGTLTLFKRGGPPIGTKDMRILDDATVDFREEHSQLCRGDRLVFYTDGVYEHQNDDGEFYGVERLYRKLSELKNKTVSDLVEQLFENVMDFGNHKKPLDDITLVGVALKSNIISADSG